MHIISNLLIRLGYNRYPFRRYVINVTKLLLCILCPGGKALNPNKLFYPDLSTYPCIFGIITPLFTQVLKHTTTIFSLSDHDSLSQERKVIVDQVQTNYYGRPMVL